jgi:hypothetical protein
MQTVKHILGATLALAMTATGASAAPGQPPTLGPLPWVITSPGTYKAPTGNTTLTCCGETPAITIASDGVVLNLNGCTINYTSGNCAIVVNVNDYPATNPAGVSSSIWIKNGMIRTTGFDGIRIAGNNSGIFNQGYAETANGVHIDHMTILVNGYSDAIKDSGNNTSITNCILGTTLGFPNPYAAWGFDPSGYGVDCRSGQGEVVSGNNFSLCPAGHAWVNFGETGDLYDSSNVIDPLPGVTGDGSVGNPWMNVPKGGVN